MNKILDAIQKAKVSRKPNLILARTLKGKGVSYMENNCDWHGKAPNQEQYEKGVAELS